GRQCGEVFLVLRLARLYASVHGIFPIQIYSVKYSLFGDVAGEMTTDEQVHTRPDELAHMFWFGCAVKTSRSAPSAQRNQNLERRILLLQFFQLMKSAAQLLRSFGIIFSVHAARSIIAVLESSFAVCNLTMIVHDFPKSVIQL